ncbi:hypothetical protein [Solitalea lacus]|uniref:hypothetical protein n=1 Tax=Solitalea lacus TaxID=2911172 RepID=UPI001EDB9A31|nr:hypothetical protein [Solitalea lacus]UKJ08992.1 hypothetical protein L2B55_07435 [Solitalea lacus]
MLIVIKLKGYSYLIMKRIVIISLEYIFLFLFLLGPLMRVVEQVAHSYGLYLRPMGLIGLYICGLGSIGLTITLLLEEFYYPDPNKPNIE